jgi:pyridoxine 4-dehydrogenase
MRTALTHGANNWNGGELYGSPERNSLHLLNEYFTKYPADAEKVVLSIKGGIVPGQMKPDGSKEGVRRSIDECLKVLDGKKFLDLFECGKWHQCAMRWLRVG